jgi:protein-S-isoprenylcysteine O-methyltransferase Ste14
LSKGRLRKIRRIDMPGEKDSYAYGLWYLVLLNIALFAIFILSFIRPRGKREWRSMGATLAFFVALFTEMYGIPLTIYILVSILGRSYPAANPFSFRSGHLWVTFLGGGTFMFVLVHVINFILVISGFLIMWRAWRLIHRAKGGLVTGGPYAFVRHPQYAGLFLIMIGMLILWPTIITALMFPVLVFMYYRLSKKEEDDMIKEFGDEYRRYMEKTPMLIPGLKRERR